MTGFVADHMLGTLAKWLRLLGYDTIYPHPTDDAALIELARREHRILLTRDKGIPQRKACSGVCVIVVKSDTAVNQAIEVLRVINAGIEGVELIGKDRPEKPVAKMEVDEMENVLTRCSECNTIIIETTKDDATTSGRVPVGVLERTHRIWKCPGCGKFYWEGTHYHRILETAQRIVEMSRTEYSQS